jgi:glycosyltransferase involved in cell wall biosynthesis
VKIAYCIASLTVPAGMERVLVTKANCLAEQFDYYDVHIITLHGGNSFFDLSKKITCHNMDIKNARDHRKKLKNILYDIRPDITVSLCGAELSFLYKIKDGSKKIVEFHFSKNYLIHLVNGIHHLKYRFLHKIKVWFAQKRESYYAPKYDKVVLLTQRDLGLWKNKSNMCYVHNPLSFRCNDKANPASKRIIAAGRLIAQKGFDLLIDAFSFISMDFPDWEVMIFGDGQDLNYLNDKIRLANLDKRIKICPSTNNIRDEFLKGSIFAFPSRYEGFGLVLTEAMECGLPCIAFDCECGPSEIITDNETGLLIPAGDVEKLSEALKKLMNDTSLRKQMGENACAGVHRFYVENIMPQWDALFKQVIQNSPCLP